MTIQRLLNLLNKYSFETKTGIKGKEMKLTWQCLFSPRLYKIYREGTPDSIYQPDGMERYADKVVRMSNALLNVGIYTSPLICIFIYRRGFFSTDETKTLFHFFGSISCFLLVSLVLRGYGRASNPKYVKFLQELTSPMENKAEYLEAIRKYDFDFAKWPATYAVPVKKSDSWLHLKTPSNVNNDLPFYQRATIQVLAFICTHTFGLRLIYPGSMGFVHNLLWDPLIQGRTQLVENLNGQRTKIQTADNNHIDTMFVDKRGSSPHGNTLVISCEGNMGFYEVGIMTTPAKAGYSALGWNHPGFAGSTGLPYPSQEHNAIDAVIQFAINELKFQPEDIVMFGWSIGGYSCAWAANYYPVKAVFLDATFDDLLPLALNQMPSSWSLLVKEVVRSYVDLNVAELLKNYDGPIHLVRRTADEIICLTPGELATNRGNHLIAKLISHRHPEEAGSFEDLIRFVSLKETQRSTADKNKIEQLVSKYMRDYKSTHCTGLPDNYFGTVMAEMFQMKKE